MLFLNLEYPTRSLGERPPLQAFPQARHSGRSYSPSAEEHMLDIQRIYDYLQDGCWFRQVSSVGVFSLGGYSYNATTQFAEQTVEITFNAITRKLICLPEKCTTAFQFDIQGLTKSTLMGSALALPGYVPYQLALPFTYPDTTF